MRGGRPTLGPGHKTIDTEGALPAPLAAASGGQVFVLTFVFVFLFFKLFCFSRLSSLFPVQSAYPRANKQIMPTLECYPGARYLYIYAYVREGPTLELPWSHAPVYTRRPPTLELP